MLSPSRQPSCRSKAVTRDRFDNATSPGRGRDRQPGAGAAGRAASWISRRGSARASASSASSFSVGRTGPRAPSSAKTRIRGVRMPVRSASACAFRRLRRMVCCSSCESSAIPFTCPGPAGSATPMRVAPRIGQLVGDPRGLPGIGMGVGSAVGRQQGKDGRVFSRTAPECHGVGQAERLRVNGRGVAPTLPRSRPLGSRGRSRCDVAVGRARRPILGRRVWFEDGRGCGSGCGKRASVKSQVPCRWHSASCRRRSGGRGSCARGPAERR